tara:strand:+ start:227 stop:481 length:255 start_codon:yes stop_codon:yes gene_type:complete
MKCFFGVYFFLIFFTASNVFAADKTPISDHQTCVAEWAKNTAESEKWYGRYRGEKGTRRSLEKQVESLRKLLEAAMAKIPNVKK